MSSSHEPSPTIGRSPAHRPSRARRPIASVTKAVAVGAAALLLTSCAVANSDGAAGGTGGGAAGALRVVLQQEPPTLEPCEANLTSTGVVVRSNITEPLIERNPTTGDLDPLLATEWEQTSDTEWTFTLRDDVTFQDGTPFDAEAAAFSIDRAVNSDLGCNVEGYVFGETDLEVNAVDATTLTVTTPEADPILPLKLSFIEIVPTTTSTTDKVREPIGTGPYQIGQWDVGTKLTLNAYDGYWGDAPAYPQVDYQWRGEGTVRAAMITGGEADIAMGLSPDDGIGENGVSYPNNETIALRFSGDIAPLDDIRVRQAINFAVDKEGIISSLYPNGDVVASQLIPEGVVGHNDSLEPWAFDLDKAKALVAEAKADGVPVDTKITLVTRTAQFPKVNELSQVLQEQLTQAGLNVELRMVDTTQHLQYQLRPFVTNEGPIALLVQHGNQAGDAQFTVDQYMSSTGAQSTFGTPEFDQKLDAAAKTSGDERQTAYEQIFADQNEEIVQFAHIAHQTGLLGIASGITYEPNSASGDELRIAEVKPAA
ncbi:peptide ABC transporter substrate-binding protein [Pseudoclavibacter sp. RFBJ3]|uniref:ABC transporter substrate-binding protein n=1 Tax=unclassified Pseudoclavibacter TaxID=2615177 RepID=UPI000CE8AD09|nr:MULTISPECIES: ABC transporter substrate-binding protein [unclassified Pseudoclavibacter]MBF4548760.1 peptide ABC transporter substrate-binding protein [Pseudoclavibacter sp. VKM Ac-2888]PPF34902.1 peptide ABC transporter substrate-binding protein [Pseudoclavibacter sp. AY1H1]PPF75560.1 peptide ABC transporter substrate-binding protein [Pseudoclavibacter sp. Z016]PPF83044.1 peptide ABC transporter substrate-binding protein [Pseudoclavibacter sp. RFBJ5]PPF91743.1 peptide ABC transporter subst